MARNDLTYIPGFSVKFFIKFLFFSNGSHLEWRAGLLDTILKGTHPGTIPARFGLIWFRRFQRRRFKKHNDELFNMYYRIVYEL
jgi:hypothetical protein